MIRIVTLFLIMKSVFAYGETVDSLQMRLANASYTVKIDLFNRLIDHYKQAKNDSVLMFYDSAISVVSKAKDTSRVFDFGLAQIEYFQEQGLFFDIAPKLEQINRYVTAQTPIPTLLKLERITGRVYWKTRDFAKAFSAFEKLKQYSIQTGDKQTEAIAINNLGLIFSETGQFDSAVDKHNLALEMYLNLKSMEDVSSTYNLLGNACLRLNKFNAAIQNYTLSIQYSEQNSDSAGISRTLKNLARTYTYKGIVDSAIVCLQKALIIEQQLHQDSRIAFIFNELGATYRSINNYSKALQNYQSALQIHRDLGDMQQIAATLNNIGTIYKDIDMTDVALDFYEEALTMHQALSNDALIALSLNYIGGVYYKKEQYDHALDYYLSALGYYEIIDDKIQNARITNNVALMYKNIGNYQKSLEYYHKALEIYQNLTDYKSFADILNNIGNLYMVQGQHQKAMEYFEKARAKRVAILDYKGLVKSNFDIACLKIKNLKYKEAIQLLLKIWNEQRVDIGFEMRRDISFQLAQSYEKMKDYKTSLKYRKRYESLNDSLLYQDMLIRISEVKTQNEAEKIYYTRALELEKKESEVQAMLKEQSLREKVLVTEATFQKRIRNLFVVVSVMMFGVLVLIYLRYRTKKQANLQSASANEQMHELNEKLKQTEDQLRLSRKTKSKLFRILAHDLRTPFAAFIDMTQRVDVTSNETVGELIKDVSQAAGALFLLTENLLEWSRMQPDQILYTPQDLSPFEIADDVSLLYLPYIKNKRIIFRNNIPENITAKSDLALLSFVFRNLIDNAAKFVRVGGKITIFYEQEAHYHKFIISDNGQGISPNDQYKLLIDKDAYATSRINNDINDHTGLKLCKEFIALWGGEMLITSELGKGTDVSFTVPL